MWQHVRPGLLLLLLLPACSGNALAPAGSASAEFAIGGDISFLPQVEEHGGVYSDAQGPRDLLVLLRDHGFNSIRLKLWHTPAEPYNTLERVLALARRIDAAGLTFLLDIHYSDTWADPQKQTKPAAWKDLSFEVLADSVRSYTRDVLRALAAQGTVPAMVQLGNEIRPGLLWPDGQVDGVFNTPGQWDRLVALLRAARQGALEGAGNPRPRLLIHFDNGAKNELCRAFFDQLAQRNLEYDAIGLSFYAKWHGTVPELRANLADLAARYGKDVYVVETAYPWTLAWHDQAGNIMGTEADLHAGYPPTVAGQGAFLRAVREAVRAVPGGRGRGVYYWAPEWIAVPGVPSAWENTTLFDFTGKVLPSMDAFTGRH